MTINSHSRFPTIKSMCVCGVCVCVCVSGVCVCGVCGVSVFGALMSVRGTLPEMDLVKQKGH